MKISLSPTIKNYWIDSNNYYSIQSFKKFINYFFNDIHLTFSETVDDRTDGIIYDIQHNRETPINKCNILLCVENCNYWNHYSHHNKYKNYYNENIKIYLYNHIDKIEQTDKYIAIPQIHIQINYLKKFYNTIQPSISINFHQKKFCLIASIINNTFKSEIYKMLLTIDHCDSIKDFPNLKTESCYHSQELLNVFQQYKFVFICENSISEGYITEKIFNCYFSKIIPIYYGSNKITDYFNKESFINIKLDQLEETKQNIINIINDEEKYNQYISENILNRMYDDENYKEKLNNFIKSL